MALCKDGRRGIEKTFAKAARTDERCIAGLKHGYETARRAGGGVVHFGLLEKMFEVSQKIKYYCEGKFAETTPMQSEAEQMSLMQEKGPYELQLVTNINRLVSGILLQNTETTIHHLAQPI